MNIAKCNGSSRYRLDFFCPVLSAGANRNLHNTEPPVIRLSYVLRDEDLVAELYYCRYVCDYLLK